MTSRAVSGARELGASAGFALSTPGFVRRTLTLDRSRELIRAGVEGREERFLTLLRGAVYARPSSPYLPLLRAAGAEFGDVAALVRGRGLEPALGQLYDEGVRLTLEEFKGRRPIERAGVALEVRAEDFDNPFVGGVVARGDVGSRGAPRRAIFALEDLEHTAAYTAIFHEANGLFGRPMAIWRPVPPGRAGIGHVLQLAKLGRTIDAWFSQSPLRPLRMAKHALFAYSTLAAIRAGGIAVPRPRYLPLRDAAIVARWLAARRPAHLNAPASSAVRVGLAAVDEGLDLSDTFFRLGGEPFTAAKAEVFDRLRARATCHYTMSDLGRVGVACAAPEALDDVHIVTDRLAMIERDRPVGFDGTTVPSLHYTTVAPTVRRIFINVESGDYGVLSERRCGCPFDDVGLRLHLHSIRSYEKLTTEGMHFLGADLLNLVERVLPSRFGGRATDYQLVEDEVDGLGRVCVMIDPSVGEVDGRAVVETVLDTLARGRSSNTMMAGLWRDGDTVAVIRRRPYETASGKILPLHAGLPVARRSSAR